MQQTEKRVGGNCDDDEVIATYNVYASSFAQQQQQLHIFQFPLRCRARPYEANEVRLFATEGLIHSDEDSIANSGSRVGGTTASTPRQETFGAVAPVIHHSSRLTMHCHIDTFGSSSFTEPQQDHRLDEDTQRAEERSKHSYNYALQSHPFNPHCDYMVGLIVDGVVHITPVTSIQQFTPIVKPPDASSMHRVGDGFLSVPSVPIVPGLAVSDRITREMLRQRSVMLNNDADTAKELQYFPIQSVESMAMRRRLWDRTGASHCFAGPAGCVGSNPFGDSKDGHNNGPYVGPRTEDCFFPPELLVSGGITGGEHVVSGDKMLRRYANRRSLVDQVHIYLRRCQVLTLDKLREMVVPPDGAFSGGASSTNQSKVQESVTDGQLLAALRDGAIWMHGVWVSKVDPNMRGNAAALREVVLLHFCESPSGALSRARLNALVSSNTLKRTVKEILESIATLNSGEKDPALRVWRLRHVPADPMERAALLEVAQNAYRQEIEFQTMQCKRLHSSIMSHLEVINTGRLVTRLHFVSRGGDRGAEGPTGAVNTAVSTAAAAAATTVATSFTDNELAPIIAFIRRLFLEHGVVNKQRAKELVLKAKQQNYPHATNAMLSAALQRCVQPFTDATWVLKTLEEPDVDRHRPLILETALELVNFGIRPFNALLAQKQQQQQPDGETAGARKEDMQKVVSRVLAEIAVYQSHERLWHLKSGNVIGQ
ncbi:hypothetical protein, conserved [Trypanosoma brucei brucei TREU927]|uniref:Sin-like protein conserved region n=1 Tax=Trypanosoma brucei brucei (strain 927/4 GUTat10.1) TaxID=185431 RepID=Q386G3_TRYB2|nr:hypothetical protein, conserved [Trypanosoma brucei brucei TREU927]EAN79318.1 hypothetical protein, conserved [Trypanosoma brucei brucei TREU927]